MHKMSAIFFKIDVCDFFSITPWTVGLLGMWGCLMGLKVL